MSRSRVRVCLQDGLRLDLNRLARKGFIKLGTNIGARGIVWTNSYWGEVARGIIGIISADMTDPHGSWLEVQIGETTQRITLVSKSRPTPKPRQWIRQAQQSAHRGFEEITCRRPFGGVCRIRQRYRHIPYRLRSYPMRTFASPQPSCRGRARLSLGSDTWGHRGRPSEQATH